MLFIFIELILFMPMKRAVLQQSHDMLRSGQIENLLPNPLVILAPFLVNKANCTVITALLKEHDLFNMFNHDVTTCRKQEELCTV